MDVYLKFCNKKKQSSDFGHEIATAGLWNNLQDCIYPGVFCFGISGIECWFIVHVYWTMQGIYRSICMEAKVKVGHCPKKVTCKTNWCIQAFRVDNIICYFCRGHFGTRSRAYIYVTKPSSVSTPANFPTPNSFLLFTSLSLCETLPVFVDIQVQNLEIIFLFSLVPYS